MDEDEKAKGSNDANDISAFKMDEYDNEESTSLGKSLFNLSGAEPTADPQRWERLRTSRACRSTVTVTRTLISP